LVPVGIALVVFFLFLLLSVWLSVNGLFSIFYYEGTYKGKVVDDQTGAPIKGAVALATWSKCYPGYAGGSCKYYDAAEAVTNEKGEFEIPGQGLRLFTFLRKMGVGVFKAGYRFGGAPDWGEGPNEHGRLIIKLLKLTLEQRKKGIGAPVGWPPLEAPYEKVKMFLKERNLDRKEKGLGGNISRKRAIEK
jgi:hypothetical protein